MVAYNETFLNEHGTERSKFQRGNYSRGGVDTKDKLSADDFYDMASYSLSELMSEITLITGSKDKRSVMVGVDDEDVDRWEDGEGVVTWEAKNTMSFGKCYSMSISKEVSKLAVAAVEFSANMDFYVYMHHSGQFLAKDTKTKVPGEVNRLNFLDITYDIYHDHLGESFFKTCDSEMDSGFDDCIYGNVSRRLRDSFGCSLPYLPKVSLDGIEICDQKDEERRNKILDEYR